MAPKAGEELLSYCGTCKMDLRAVVIAMDGAKIAKVQCKTCRGIKGYRAPLGAKEPGAVAPTRRRSAEPTEEREIKTVSVGVEWKRLLDESKAQPRVDYSIRAQLKAGDIVKHPTFGEGIVMKLHFPNKAEIIFQDDVRLLMHSKT